MTFDNRIPVLLTELRRLAEVAKDAVADYLIAYHGADRADQDNIHNTLLVLPTDVLRTLGLRWMKAEIACYEKDTFAMLCQTYHSDMMMLFSAHYDCWIREEELKGYTTEVLGWNLNSEYKVESVGRLEYVKDVFGFRASCNDILQNLAIDARFDTGTYDYHTDPVKDFRIRRLNVCDAINSAVGIQEDHYHGLGTRLVGRSVIVSVRWTRLIQNGQVAYVLCDPMMGDGHPNDCSEAQFITRFHRGAMNEFGYMWGQDW
jgi:hypothetical protein